MSKNIIFKGVATALITPMKEGRIDYDALSNIIELQIASGIDALVVGGTTAEIATLSDGERKELYSFAKNITRGRCKIIFGTGTNDTKAVISHTRVAEEIGCDGILVVTPYYNKGTHSGVLCHYERIAKETDLPIILYNVPSRTGVNLTIAQLEELSRWKNIVAIKEASDSADRLTEIAGLKEELTLYAGNDSQIYLTLALGGMGVISVASNIYPKIVMKICHSYFSGDLDSSLSTQIKILDFVKALFCETNPSPIKYAMSREGLCTEELRLPLLPPSEENKRIIEIEMRHLFKSR